MLSALRRLWLFLFLAGSIVAIIVMLRQETSRLTMPSLVAPRYLAIAVVVQVLFWWSAAVMWSNVVKSAAGSGLSFLDSFRQLALVSLGKYLPGKVWGIVARGSQMMSQGTGAQQSAVATFYEQFILLHSAVVLCAVLFAAQRPSALTIIAAVLAVASAVFGSLISTLLVKLGGWLAARAGLGFSEADLVALRGLDYLKLVAGYSLVWILSGTIFLCLYLAFFPAQPDIATAIGIVMANAISIAVGFFAIFAPGGIGVREAIAASVLMAYMPLAEAAVIVILFRIWTVAMDGIAGIAVLVGVRGAGQGD